MNLKIYEEKNRIDKKFNEEILRVENEIHAQVEKIVKSYDYGNIYVRYIGKKEEISVGSWKLWLYEINNSDSFRLVLRLYDFPSSKLFSQLNTIGTYVVENITFEKGYDASNRSRDLRLITLCLLYDVNGLKI